MAYPIITLSNLTLNYDNKALFSHVNLSISKGERICLVGRNGSGKSSLLKTIAGAIKPETGIRFLKPGLNISFLEQYYDLSKFATLGEYILEGLTEVDYLKHEKQFLDLIVDFDQSPSRASGGELRRASLIRTLILPSDILLLDEPTNHLDLRAIEFLEQYLIASRKAFILISHDRMFLKNLCNKILWIDRGSVQKINKKFHHFEDFRDKKHALEIDTVQKLKNKIKKESIWAIEGISARRKRNQRRLKELQALKIKQSMVRPLPVVPKLNFSHSMQSAKLVLEANDISKSYNKLDIIKSFSFTIQRGDRIAIVGPNGVGKTTLINLLLKKEEPDTGEVKLGLSLNIAIFEQNKELLPLGMTVWNFLSGTQELGKTEKTEKTDHILVQNKARHIISYLNEFLFTREQIYGKIQDLSGGEKSRLLLAKLMAKSSNMLVLDEPTNDLDLETLDLLKELIACYPGTVIFSSHDRDFIDAIATQTISLEREKPIIIYSGGFSSLPRPKLEKIPVSSKIDVSKVSTVKNKNSWKKKSSYRQIEENLVKTEKKIETLTNEIKKLELVLSNKNLYIEDKKKFELVSKELILRQEKLAEVENEWYRYQESLLTD